jgi:hypothetical protein
MREPADEQRRIGADARIQKPFGCSDLIPIEGFKRKLWL